mgnify:CR=1 FL=1
MKIQEAIQLAVKNGWEYKMFGFDCEINTNDHTFLDPTFWIALGKGMEWGGSDGVHQKEIVDNHFCLKCTKEHWTAYWHRFIDHLASGNSPESYFEGLK